jgi:hypothetical protein
MPLDLSRTLDRVQERQWALADIDWDAPGAELITDEQRPKLAAFMADVAWIEQVGARAFAALARRAQDPTLAELYRYFHAEEQRHANAEIALMRRWGMLEGDEPPEPHISIRLAMDWLDRFADSLPLPVLGSAIPMLEVALDGALLKFLTEEVPDPLCQVVFDKVNNDESRHLAPCACAHPGPGIAVARRAHVAAGGDALVLQRTRQRRGHGALRGEALRGHGPLREAR